MSLYRLPPLRKKVKAVYYDEELPQPIIQNITKRKNSEARRRLKGRIYMGASIIVAIIIWWILSQTIFTNVPNPAETVKFSMKTIGTPFYYDSIIASTGRVLVGFVLAIIAGTIVGLMMGWRRRVRDWTFPAAEILRHIPPVAWVPLTIVILASLTPAIILVIFIGTFFAVVLNAMLGVQSIELSTFRAAACLGANQRQIFRHILLPGALPALLNGMVLGMGLAWMSVVAAEMISGDYGIGYFAWQSYSLVRFPEIILAMLTIGALAYGSSEVIRLIGNRFLKWRKVYD